MSSWNVLEESGRVENFHNGSELCDLQNRGQGITPSGRPRGRLPDEALFLVQILDLGVTMIGASSATVPFDGYFQKLFRPEVGLEEICR
jgi:hypothetical protein